MKLRGSKLEKMLRRTFGDKTGGVMMEYVILAVLIAAAVVVAVAVFGKTIVGMFDVAGKGAVGDHKTALTTRNQVKSDQDAGATDAATYHDDMHK